jgi:hypothetical protein
VVAVEVAMRRTRRAGGGTRFPMVRMAWIVGVGIIARVVVGRVENGLRSINQTRAQSGSKHAARDPPQSATPAQPHMSLSLLIEESWEEN